MFNNREQSESSIILYSHLTGIQRLDLEDDYGRIIKV